MAPEEWRFFQWGPEATIDKEALDCAVEVVIFLRHLCEVIFFEARRALVSLCRSMDMEAVEGFIFERIRMLVGVPIIASQPKDSERPWHLIAKNHREVHHVQSRLPDRDYEFVPRFAGEREVLTLVLEPLGHLFDWIESIRSSLFLGDESPDLVVG